MQLLTHWTICVKCLSIHHVQMSPAQMREFTAHTSYCLDYIGGGCSIHFSPTHSLVRLEAVFYAPTLQQELLGCY